MAVPALHSGQNIIHQSSKMLDTAAQDIARTSATRAPTRDTVAHTNQTDAHDTHSPAKVDPTTAFVHLEQASQYNRVGANVLQREQDMIGSLINIQV